MSLSPELDEAGRPTPVTTFLAVHHALRRDAHRFAAAVATGADMAGHWTQYRSILTTHHQQEDGLMFPLLVSRHPDLAPIITRLDDDHTALEDLLADLDAAFAVRSAEAIVPLASRLADVLDGHLDLEEEHLVPVMSAATPGPHRPAGDFGGLDPAFVLPWLADGLPAALVEALLADLPDHLQASFPEWQQAYAAQWPEGVVVVQ